MHESTKQTFGESPKAKKDSNQQQGGNSEEQTNELEMLRKENCKLQAANRLMMGAVHDIQNLITPIHYGLNLIISSKIPNTEHNRVMKLVRESGESLLEFSNDLLDFAQMSGDQEFELHEKTFNLRCIIEKVMQIVTPRAETKSLSCDCEVAADVPEIVRGDQVRLKRVLLNLIGNAIKFTNKGGVKLIIETMAGNPNGIFFRIEDTGIGIPEEDRELLFRPFAQAGSHIQNQFGGSGLGLSICKQIVDKMDGQIGIDTTRSPETGTTIWFYCKLENSNSSIPPIPSPSNLPKSVTKQKSILVVDDSASNRAVAEGMIKKLGYRVSSVDSAQKVLEEADMLQHDLMLMDCRMPIIDGYKAARQLRERGVTIPIIAYTAAGNKQDALDAGMNDQLAKPVPLDELAVTLERFLFND